MAATYSRKPGPGRPKGSINKRTLEIGGPLTEQKKKVTRALLDKVVPDRELAVLLWRCALKAKNDPRYIPAMLAVADRKWGRVKFEMEHSGSERTFILLLGSPGAGMTIDTFEYRPMGRVPGMEPRSLPPADGEGHET